MMSETYVELNSHYDTETEDQWERRQVNGWSRAVRVAIESGDQDTVAYNLYDWTRVMAHFARRVLARDFHG